MHRFGRFTVGFADMASYKVMSWRGIPSQVKASDETGAVVRRLLPATFQQEIDRVAMAEGLIETDEYLEAWTWSGEAYRDGTATEVAETLVEELARSWRKQNEAT